MCRLSQSGRSVESYIYIKMRTQYKSSPRVWWYFQKGLDTDSYGDSGREYTVSYIYEVKRFPSVFSDRRLTVHVCVVNTDVYAVIRLEYNYLTAAFHFLQTSVLHLAPSLTVHSKSGLSRKQQTI